MINNVIVVVSVLFCFFNVLDATESRKIFTLVQHKARCKKIVGSVEGGILQNRV